ncbi:Cilia- and flagella-associated protein 46, partial [Pleodorina starrii]
MEAPCAHVHVQVGSLDVAQDCLERYFLELRRYGVGMAPLEIRDQYLCRAHFARGLLVSERSKGLKGRELIDGTLESISHVMAGLEVAAANMRYQFLVYNASVHHWRVAAPLHRDGLRSQLLPSTERVVQALDKVPGHEEWKVRCYTALALCQADAAGVSQQGSGAAAAAAAGGGGGGRGGGGGPSFDEAAKTLQRAYDTAGAAKLVELQRDVARLQVHLTTLAYGSAAALGGGGKASKAAAPAAGAGRAGARGAKGAAVVPQQPTLDEEGALRLIQSVLTGRPDRAIAEQQLRDAVAKVDPHGPDGRVKGALLRPVSRAAWAAAVAGLPEVAERWASRAAASSDSGPRTWSDLTRVLLALQALGPTGDTSLAPAVVAAHVKALEQLEDCLTTFTKLADVEGIHAAARLAWNAGLLLLQPPLRRHVKRAFNAAARALAVAASPLTRLRAALHLEAAKCDAAEEALIKAGQEVGKALALDYLPSPSEAAAVPWLPRPLDRWAGPLARSLALRTSAEPANPEEEAVSLIERSKESRNPAIKADLLARAREKLRDLPPLLPPGPAAPAAAPAAADSSAPTPERCAAHAAARRRTAVWAELVRSAAASRMDEHVLAAAPYALAMEWSPAVDREMVLLQAQLSYLEAEAAISALKRQRSELTPPTRPEPPPLDDEGVRMTPTTPRQMRELVMMATVSAMRGAASVSEPWLTINAAVQLYNAALPCMQQHRYADLYRWLRPAAEALVALKPGDSDGPLAVAVAEALGRAAEHRLLLAAARAKAAKAEGREEVEDDGEEEDGEGDAPP